MKKIKIRDIVFWVVVFLISVNIIISYMDYKKVVDKKEPMIFLSKKESNGVTTYNEALFKIVVEEDYNSRDISLKLFFIE